MSNTVPDAISWLSNMPKAAERALAETLNQAATATRSRAIDEIGRQLNLPRSYISENIAVRSRANPQKLEVIISAESRGILLNRFDGQQITTDGKNAGVSVQVKAGGPRKTIKRGFFMRLKNGVTGLAMRTGKGKGAIEVLHGPSVSQAWQSVRDDVEPTPDELFNAFIERFNP
ncbi:phage tail protein [Arsukibacterium indicum]|uniref:Phage tail protein n=1 Tax=Arsukibacterium indicum TaxID=2848612 RepID=A0ABS6MHS3_9GAMM|nr:phage tail protein [Arsukibacterium indicum]MBV2127924.1 phage tail protein [Arsukibacterium indicum]